MKNICYHFLLVFVLLSYFDRAAAQEENKILIVGGGNTLDNSQVSILKNTQWILKNLETRSDADIQLAFNNGLSTENDAFFHNPIEEISIGELIAYIKSGSLPNTYIKSEFTTTHSPTHSSAVLELIENYSTNDRLLFIYQGHGLKGNDLLHFNNNYLALWENSRLTVKDLDKALRDTKAQSFRFVLPQCYSGAFQNLIYKDLYPGNGLTEQKRCGFTSQLPFLLSEGCTPDINEANYRDYSTFFFEALFNSSRTVGSLPENPDFNEDGSVSPYEAHIYTLRNAVSMDFSKSSSEYYLEQWAQPFYQWLPAAYNRENIYYDVAVKLSARFSTDLIDAEARKKAIAELKNKYLASSKIEKEKKSKLDSLRADLNKFLEKTAQGNKETITLDQIEDSGLFGKYREWKQQGLTSRNLQRKLVQVNKIDSMLNLARISNLFKKYASKIDKAEYKQLLSCESASL